MNHCPICGHISFWCRVGGGTTHTPCRYHEEECKAESALQAQKERTK